MANCKNCDNNFKGRFCNLCGEKVVESTDFSLSQIIQNALGAVTNLDSKLYRTILLLFTQPGALSRHYIEGLRKPFALPFQIFVVANILFFLLLSDLDIFRTPSKWYFVENFDGTMVLDVARKVGERESVDLDTVAHWYDVRSENLSKALILLIIPFIAIIGSLLHFKKKWEFGKHLIFATHFFAFFLITCVGIIHISQLLPNEIKRGFFLITTMAITLLYYSLSTKRFYEESWSNSIIKGIAGVMMILCSIYFYRVIVNMISLYSL